MIKSALKKIMVFIGVIWLIVVLLSIVLTILISSHKNEITKAILLSVNSQQGGEFKLDDVDFIPFRQFPDLSINLKNISYFEKKSANRKLDEQPIARIYNFYLGFDVIDLLNGKLNIRKLLIDGGELTIVTYPDSSINLINALGIKENKSKTEEDKRTVINVEQLSINKLHLKFQNFLEDKESTFLIKNLEAGFSYTGQEANLNLITSILIEDIRLNKNLSLKNKNLNLNIRAHLDSDKKLEIQESKLEYENSVFKFNGFFNPQNDGELDLKLDGSAAGLELFSQILKQKGKDNFKKGNFYFNGSIRGKTFIQIPFMDFTFGFNNVELLNPITKREIKNVNCKGHFNSGNKDDFSEARLKIDTLYADFPDGALKLSGSVKNFTAPEFDTQLFLNADVTGLDKVFKLDFMDNLKGRIEINDRFKGKYLVKEKRFSSEINNANIYLEDFGFTIPGALKIDRMNGNISRKNDDYYFDNLSVLSDDTDLLINGKIENFQYLIFNIEKEINADLKIKSSIFDLPNFLAFDPSIKRDFNYRILNVDVDVLAKTTTSKALNFKSFPQIDFDIKKLDATAENFLPPLKIKSGRFKISESILGFNLKFDKFKTKFLDGNFNFTGEYNSSKFQPFYIKANTNFTNISPSKLLYDENDTIPEPLSGKLSGSFFGELQFPVDSTFIKFINLKEGNLLYQFSGDTITTKSLSLSLSDVYFNDAVNSNPLATLSTKGNIKAAELRSKGLNLDDIKMDLNVQDGTYKINSNQVRFFGKNAKGKSYVELSPFSDLPSYHINFNVNKFFAEEMLESFLLDTMITGPLSLSMDVESQGSNWVAIVSNMKGSINLSGKNLIFYGMDADKVIDKFKRSQNFNLVDLGAVLLAGPVGIAVTKGSDFATLLIANPGESSKITNLVSNWELKNGDFMIKDAAFTTTKNRIAATGSINFSKNNLNLTIALLNKYGCSVFSQNIFGNLDSPTLGKVKVVGTLFAPVTNLVDDILGNDCDVFYNGSVKHPIK